MKHDTQLTGQTVPLHISQLVKTDEHKEQLPFCIITEDESHPVQMIELIFFGFNSHLPQLVSDVGHAKQVLEVLFNANLLAHLLQLTVVEKVQSEQLGIA